MNKTNLQIMFLLLPLCTSSTFKPKQHDTRSIGSLNHSPFHDSFFENIQDLHNDFFGNNFFTNTRSGQTDFSINMFEKDGNIIVEMNAPGIQESDIELEMINDNTLRISGVRQSSQQSESNNYYKKEIKYGSFERTLNLPSTIDEDNVTAEIEHGVLRIHLPIKEHVKSKTKKILFKKKK